MIPLTEFLKDNTFVCTNATKWYVQLTSSEFAKYIGIPVQSFDDVPDEVDGYKCSAKGLISIILDGNLQLVDAPWWNQTLIERLCVSQIRMDENTVALLIGA